MDVPEILSSIVMIVCSTFGIICALIFIIIVATHRECHTLTILLVLNSTIAGFMASLTCIIQAIYQLLDLGNDRLCSIRGLILHTSTGIFYHTLCVQGLYRLFVTVYSTRRYFQTIRFTISMVVVQWIFSTTFGLPIYFTDRIKYQPGSRMCQVKVKDSLEEFRNVNNRLFVGFIGRYNRFSLYGINHFFHTVDIDRLHLCSNCSVYEN